MRRILTGLIAAVTGAASIAVLTGTGTAAASPAHTGWAAARTVPGLSKLNKDGNGGAAALACASAGNCVTGGFYTDSHLHEQAWLAVQRKGKWGNAFEIPGSGKLNVGGDGGVAAISCPSAGNCVVTGGYEAKANSLEVFTDSERNGRWAKATALRGFAALNAGDDSNVLALSCSAAGDCTAGGDYLDSNDHVQAFLATEKDHHWAKAEKVPGIGNLNAGGHSHVTEVSCRKVGYCTAAGDTQRSAAVYTAFVISERKGHWGTAARLPNMVNLNKNGNAQVNAGECSSAGNCVVGGSYLDSSGYFQAYLDVEKNGHWRNAFEVPGTGSLNKGHQAHVSALACPSAGNCAVGGYYTNGANHGELFLIGERKGSWGKAREMPGLSSRNKGSTAQIYAMSCSSAGHCYGVGYYENSGFRELAYTISESGGHWAALRRVPGITSLSAGGDSDLNVVVCKSTGHCTAGGFGQSATHQGLAIVVSRT